MSKDSSVVFLLLSIGIWVVTVYSTRVAAAGDPLQRLLASALPGVVDRADRMADGERVPTPPEDIHFLRRLARTTLLEFTVLVLEFTVLLAMLYSGRYRLLSGLLLGKELGMIGFVYTQVRRMDRHRILGSLRDLPGWIHALNRMSALITAAGFLVLFLRLNRVL